MFCKIENYIILHFKFKTFTELNFNFNNKLVHYIDDNCITKNLLL